MEPPASIETVAHPHLRTLLADVTTVTAETERLRATLSDAQCIWKPEPGVWNVLECFHHLIVTDKLYGPRLRAAIEKASREGGSTPFRPSLFGKTLRRLAAPVGGATRLGKPPPGRSDTSSSG